MIFRDVKTFRTHSAVIKKIYLNKDKEWAALRKKVPNVLSHCHTFFWYYTDFLDYFWKKNFWIFLFIYFFFFEKSVPYQKKGGRSPSFGMTTTQDIRDLFA